MTDQIGQRDRKNNPDTIADPASQLFPQLLENQRKQKLKSSMETRRNEKKKNT